jgi:hypothetical protein
MAVLKDLLEEGAEPVGVIKIQNYFFMEIYNDKVYSSYVAKISLILGIGTILCIFFIPLNWLIALIIAFLIEIVFLSERFTIYIKVNDVQVEFQYYLFFKKHTIRIPKNVAGLKVYRSVTFRNSSFLTLEILSHGKKVHKLDSRSGFSDEQLERIADV